MLLQFFSRSHVNIEQFGNTDNMIRKATLSDLEVAMQLFDNSRQIMRRNGNATQWSNGYPQQEIIEKDTINGDFYCICNEDEIVGCFSFIIGDDPTYNKIEKGEWIDTLHTYGTIHRLACAPGQHSIARQCIERCEEQVDSLRADTHSDNIIVQHILEQQNFRYCGIIHVADGTPRRAYQKLIYHEIPLSLRAYVEQKILPMHDNFDKAHRRDHILSVIDNSMQLAQYYPVDHTMVYTIAAFHDTGAGKNRELHHLISSEIIHEDPNLPKWFNAEQIETMAQAAEDHRASINKEPRSIYGKIVAEADRDVYKEKIVRRTIEFGIDNYPGLDKEGYWQRTLKHLHEKYAEGGYIKLWLPKSPNEKRLEELRELIKDETKLRTMFEEVYEETARGER